MPRDRRHSLRRFAALARLAVAALSLAPWAAAAAEMPDPLPATDSFTVSGAVPGVSLQQIASGLGQVTAITHTGDARLFITTQDGRVLIFRNGSVQATPFLDLRSLTNAGGERGLLSTAFHPRYAENGLLFVDYTNLAGNTVIARYRVSSDPDRADPASARVLLTIDQPFANHNGGQLQFGPDGYLYIGMGDGGAAFDPECRAQRVDSLLGKLLRIDVDQHADTTPFYGIPADNPFRGAGDPPDEVWASGLRNPWRFSFDRQTGDLWIGDVGQGEREEIDFQPASSHGGENYGWKVMEGTRCSSSDACPAGTPPCDSAAFTAPVLEYDHGAGCSVSGGYVYRGGIASLRGAYLFGDFCAGTVWAAFRQGSGFTVQSVPPTTPQLTTFGEDVAGELYAGTQAGTLYRVTATGGGGGGAETVGMFDPLPSRFQLKTANSAAAAVRVVAFGRRRSGWLPLAGDWNADGKTTVGLYDPSASIFRLKNGSTGSAADVILHLPKPSAAVVPVSGDWDGDGRDTVGLYDRTTGIFHLINALDGTGFELTVPFGSPGELRTPVIGDWNGNGADSVGLYDPRNGTFTLKAVLVGGGPDTVVAFGPAGRSSLPLAGDWDGDGRDGVGVYDVVTAVVRLRNALTAGAPDVQFRFGPRRGGWLPLAGAW